MKLLLTGLIIALLAAFYYYLINLDEFDGELVLNMEEDEEVRRKTKGRRNMKKEDGN